MRLVHLAVLGLFLPAACGPTPPPQQSVTLPPTVRMQGAGDPTRGAILASSYVFAQPGSVAGNPAAVAEALAQLEYLAVEIATGPRWIEMDSLVAPMLAQGRDEARAAFGLDPAAPPQRAIDALYGTAAALRNDNRAGALAALTPLTGPDRAAATLERLSSMPTLPRAAAATTRARQALDRRDRGDRQGLFPF